MTNLSLTIFLPLKSTSISLFSLTSCKNLLLEIKNVNNQLFDYEMVIAEKKNTESLAGVATEQGEELLVHTMYNAVTINQNLVSHFTYDKKVNGFIFYFQLFALIILIFISLTMYILVLHIDQTIEVCLFLQVIYLPLLLFRMNCG